MIQNIGAFYDSDCTLALDLSEDGTEWIINKPQLFETVVENPNTTFVYLKNFETFPIYNPYLVITQDDFHAIFGERKVSISLDGEQPVYNLYLGDTQESNQVIKITLRIDVPRSLQQRENVIIALAYHNITYLPDMPVYRPPA